MKLAFHFAPSASPTQSAARGAALGQHLRHCQDCIHFETCLYGIFQKAHHARCVLCLRITHAGPRHAGARHAAMYTYVSQAHAQANISLQFKCHLLYCCFLLISTAPCLSWHELPTFSDLVLLPGVCHCIVSGSRCVTHHSRILASVAQALEDAAEAKV